MHVGGLSIFEGPAPPFERLEAMVDGKLGLVPRYRQKVRFVPLGLGRPVWVDDPHFNLSYHLRHSALPSPGSDEQLRSTAARVFAQHLDRHKPLWEIWMIEGLSRGRWALLSKVHHCMVDGVAATDLMSVMFDEGSPPLEQRPVDAGTRAGRRGAPRAHPHAQDIRPGRAAAQPASGGPGTPLDARRGRGAARGPDLRGPGDSPDRPLLADRLRRTRIGPGASPS